MEQSYKGGRQVNELPGSTVRQQHKEGWGEEDTKSDINNSWRHQSGHRVARLGYMYAIWHMEDFLLPIGELCPGERREGRSANLTEQTGLLSSEGLCRFMWLHEQGQPPIFPICDHSYCTLEYCLQFLYNQSILIEKHLWTKISRIKYQQRLDRDSYKCSVLSRNP